MISNNIVDTAATMNHKFQDIHHKEYIVVPQPTMCLIQPNLAYKSCRIDSINYRIITLLSTCIDIILADPGYLPELLAWDSLKLLIPILDIAIDTTSNIINDYQLNTIKYTEWTMHDDLDDAKHQSQYFRRYGHKYDMNTISSISRISSSIATAKTSINVSGLQFLVDTIGASTGRTHGYSYHMSYLLPKYLQVLSDFSNGDNDNSAREDPYKAFIRVKLDDISNILSKSSYLSSCAPNKSFNELINGLNKYIPVLAGVRENILYDILPLEPLHITDRDCSGLKLLLKQIAPESPLAHLSTSSLRSILYNEGNVTEALSIAAKEIEKEQLDLKSMGIIEDVDSEPSTAFWGDNNDNNDINKLDEIIINTSSSSNQNE
jgi:hypothetical protein